MSIAYDPAEPPATGHVLEICPGLFWVRMPLPFPPDHINLWLLDDGAAGFAIVDTGLHREDSKAHWLAAIGTRQISRVICTHFHPDHMGLAAWLCAQFGVELWTTLGEYYTARAVHAQGSDADIAHKVAFYAANGVAADAMGQFASPQNIYRRGVPDLPAFYRRIQGGKSFAVGDVAWTPIVGRGHCPEHACLWAPQTNVLIGGDILLPRITPNIGVWPAEPLADPLGDYLACLDGFSGVPEEALILPAHGQPYTGVHARIAEIRAHHAERLDVLRAAFAGAPQGLSAVDCFPLLFKRAIGPHNVGLAVGEALAHLHRLECQGDAQRVRDAQGVWRFSAAS